MNYVIIITSIGTNIYSGAPNQTASEIAQTAGVTDSAFYQEFNSEDFDPVCFNFPNAFTLNAGIVSFDLQIAKQIGETIVNQRSNEKAKANLAGLSYDVYMAQCALPIEQRTAKYQAAIDANNVNALETEQYEQAIYAAKTIEEVNAIVYPSSDEVA